MTAQSSSTSFEQQTEDQRAFVDGLRELADFLEAHPEVPADYGVTVIANANDYGTGPTAIQRLARVARIPGGWTKEVNESTFTLGRAFGPHKLLVFAGREHVCEAVVTTETVTREVPDPDALSQVPTVTVTESVERVEWVCAPSLLAVDPPVTPQEDEAWAERGWKESRDA